MVFGRRIAALAERVHDLGEELEGCDEIAGREAKSDGTFGSWRIHDVGFIFVAILLLFHQRGSAASCLGKAPMNSNRTGDIKKFARTGDKVRSDSSSGEFTSREAS